MSYNIDTVHDFGNLPFAADDTLADQGLRFVTIQSDGQVAVTAAGAAADGILRAGVTEGFSPVVVTSGAWAYVIAEEALSFGQEVTVGASGGAVAATTGDAQMGTVIEEDDAGDSIVRIKLRDGTTSAA